MNEKDPSQPTKNDNNMMREIASYNNCNITQKETTMSQELYSYINKLELSLSENKEKIKSHSLILKEYQEFVHLKLIWFTGACQDILQNIDEWVKQLSCSQIMIDQSFEAIKYFSIEQKIEVLDSQSNKLLNYDIDQNDVIDRIKSHLPTSDFEYYDKFNLDELYGLYLEFSKEIGLFNKITEQFRSERNDLQASGEINLKEIGSYLIPQNQQCFVMVFNKESTLMVAGCWQTIQVYSFNEGELNLIQSLSDHTDNVMALYFMKKRNDCKNEIQFNSKNQWIIQNFQRKFEREF